MKVFKLPKPFFFLSCELFQVGWSEQSNKTHNFRGIIFVDAITLPLYSPCHGTNIAFWARYRNIYNTIKYR